MTSIIKVDEIQNSAGTTTLAKVDNGVLTGALSPATGFRNRIINGDMRISQRNGTSAGTYGAGSAYWLDRWFNTATIASNMQVQQTGGAPSGFINSTTFTALTGATIGASDFFSSEQKIEGLNVSDLAWGTSSAQPVTLSFYVFSSLTGTFGGSIRNSAVNRSYPFSYTINATNTWEYKTVTIPGDTTGTWLTTNGVGITLNFDLGSGSTFRGSSGAWASANYLGATGSVSPMATNGATFNITGVQLEKGTVATPFEFRSIGQELALCQRYFEKSYNLDVVPGTATFLGSAFVSTSPGVANNGNTIVFATTKRATPTISFWDLNGNSAKGSTFDGSANVTHNQTQAAPTYTIGTSSFVARYSNGVSGAVACAYQWTAVSEP
jgi:hypothetical protein